MTLIAPRNSHYLIALVRTGKLFCSTVYRAVREEWLSQYMPVKPTVLQFPINDICNSRCVMCDIWRRKQDKEITVEELSRVLNDPLFSNIRYVGINGGEPTLRRDLPDIGQVLVGSLPKLRGMGIITNAVSTRKVIERTLALARVAEKADISYGVSVSLDGIGADHDRNRGVKGSFSSAAEVVRVCKSNGLPVAIGCTLTASNCYGADDVLRWCEENHIKRWEFRIAVDIKRLYNEGYTLRHPFTPEQRFHLIMFFDKLAHYPQVDPAHRRFYRSLADQLASGRPRQAGCAWRTRGVTLDTRGNISYCSVQSPILGSAIEQSAWQVYKDNLLERKRIIEKHCAACQHDLIGPPTPRQMIREGVFLARGYGHRLAKRFAPTNGRLRAPKRISPADHNSTASWQQVLITGWYGTETAGDKAILGEVLHFIKTASPGCRITLTTLNRKVSQQTRLELADLKNVSIVDMDKAHDPGLIESVDAVIIGGGPLEEISQTKYIWQMFVEANRQRKARIIFGCGIGPLHTDNVRKMVASICQMTTAGFVRDEESHKYALRLGATAPLEYACDPALAYIRRWVASSVRTTPTGERLHIAGLVRANTHEYMVDMPPAELQESNARVARQIARILETANRQIGAKVVLLPMHAVWLGGDDRIFNREVANCFIDPETVRMERRYLPLETLLKLLQSTDIAVVMRYHGHLFSMALGIPFLSINYTGRRSKIESLISCIGYDQWVENWHNIDESRASSRLRQLIDERAQWSTHLQRHADELVHQLQQTYARVFNIPK